MSCRAAVFSELGAVTASFLPATFSDLTMPVVQRPAAAPRRVHRRPAAASELPANMKHASRGTQKHAMTEAELKRTTLEQGQAVSRGTGVCEKKAPWTKSRQTPSPRPFNVEPRSTLTNRTQAHQSNIA